MRHETDGRARASLAGEARPARPTPAPAPAPTRARAPAPARALALAALLALAPWAALAIPACGSASFEDSGGAAKRVPDAAEPAHAGAAERAWLKRVRKEGSRLWGVHCGRCHNIRSAATCSVPGQCEICVSHMRVRAYLTGDETRLIAAYLELTRPE